MVLAVFSKAQGSPKGVKMVAKMEPQGTQNHKNSRKKNTPKNMKNATPKSGSPFAF